MFKHSIRRGLFLFALAAFGCEGGQDLAPVNPQGGMGGAGGATGAGGSAPIQCDTTGDCPRGQLCDDGQCIRCSDDATCRNEFGDQFGCLEGLCIEVCTPGALDCICDEGECNAGLLCQENVCTNCTDGVNGCPCREDASPCDEGLVCGAENNCEPCAEGLIGCPCAEGSMCESGGYCEAGACVPCNSSVVGCPCDETGACEGRLICDEESSQCREPRTCDEIDCVLYQLCAPNESGILVCLELCEEGYVWVPSEGVCAVTGSNCQADHPASLAPQCSELNRLCQELDDSAACGACRVGFKEVDEMDACVAVETCETLDCAGQNRACTPETDHEDARCEECLPFHLESENICRAVRTCLDEGCAEQNRTCMAETEDADAQCGECIAFHLEEDGRCRTVRNCEDQGCANQNRGCTPPTEEADAICTVCLPGYLEEDGICRAVRSCDEVGCEAVNRLCTPETLEADATCGGCEPFYLEAEGVCRQVDTCLQLDCLEQNRTCIDETEVSDAFCDECLPEFLAEDGECRPVRGCGDVGCRILNRACVAPDQASDASCGACLPGFLPPPPPPDPCAAVDCDEGLICQAGECVDDPCEAVDCAEEEACVNGECRGAADEDEVVDPPAQIEEQPEPCIEDPDAVCEPEEDEASILAQCREANRVCNSKPDDPALCGPCLEGFIEDRHRDLCVPLVDCVELGCALRNRVCEESPVAECTECLPGFVESDDGDCRARVTCRDLDCAEGQICIDVSVNADAVCGVSECDAGQAWDVRGRRCIDCPPCDGAAGQTGRPWPVATRDGQCVCETRDGFFHPLDDGQSTQPCDGDNDGWLRENVRPALESADPAFFENARCDLRTIDRVLLRNHLGQERLVRLGRIRALGTSVVELYESILNDDQGLMEQAIDNGEMAPYGPGGRPLRATELNRFTKACVDPRQDYNGNGSPDISEWDLQPVPAGVEPRLASDYRALNMFSHFMELHRGWYEQDNPLERFGMYVIEEHQRNQGAQADRLVAMDYFDAEIENTYRWRMCPGVIDSSFDENRSTIGMDFARISILEADMDFRGMTHHSNYKCITVVDERPANPAVARHLTTIDGLTLGAHRPNQCSTQGEPNPPVNALANPRYPQVSCELLDVEDIAVGFTGWSAQTWPNLAGPCEEGLGICVRPGEVICNADGTGPSCTAEPGQPEAEVCDALDNDCDGIVDNGAPAQLCPPPADTVATECLAGGQCSIAQCSDFQVDVDGAYINGCECEDLLAGGPSCQEAIDLGQIGNGIRISPQGTLPEGASEEWFTVEFPSDAGDNEPEPGNPRIEFEVANEAFEMDVFTGCNQPTVICGDGDNGGGIGSWSFNDEQGEGVTAFSDRDVDWPGRMWIRVYRNEDVASCAGYRIRVSR